jgi:hypothetical protein
LLTEGNCSVCFQTPIGEGTGVVKLRPNGQVTGRDTTFSYTGNWKQDSKQFKITVFAKRTEPGPPGVFGMDELDIIVTGQSHDGVSASCVGFAKQSPGLKLQVTLVRIGDD